jgi:gamma-glutamylcysteine synthetase
MHARSGVNHCSTTFQQSRPIAILEGRPANAARWRRLAADGAGYRAQIEL